MTDDELIHIVNLFNLLRGVHSFLGKKTLLTLAIPPNTERDTIINIIRNFQAGLPTRRDKDQAKLISDMVRETVNEVSKWEEIISKGTILFAGPIKGKGGAKEIIIKTSPFIRGYENYVKGYIDTKFHLEPLERWMGSRRMDFSYHQTEEFTRELNDIKRELNKRPDRVTYGISHVIHDIKANRASKIIASTRLSMLARCPLCGVSIEISSSVCKYCQGRVGNLCSQLEDVKNLCEGSNVRLLCFNESIAHILDKEFFSIVCIRRY